MDSRDSAKPTADDVMGIADTPFYWARNAPSQLLKLSCRG